MAKQVTIKTFLEVPLRKLQTPQAKTFFLQTWYRQMVPYIPFRNGILASGTDLQGVSMTPMQATEIMQANINQYIAFTAPYAAHLYDGDGFNFSKEQHPLAQARWAETAWALHGDQIMDDYKKYLLRSK